MGETEFKLAISCQQTKLLMPELDYMQLSCWSKRPLWNPQRTQAIAKTIGCSPQIDSKAPLLKTASTEIIEYGEIELVPK